MLRIELLHRPYADETLGILSNQYDHYMTLSGQKYIVMKRNV